MEEKNIAMVVLGIVAILAIIGLVLMFQTVKTGEAASARANQPYPGGVALPTSRLIESPGFDSGYSWTQKPTTSIKYGEPIKTCKELTYVGTIQSGYTVDANVAETSGKDCLRVDGSIKGFCCRP